MSSGAELGLSNKFKQAAQSPLYVSTINGDRIKGTCVFGNKGVGGYQGTTTIITAVVVIVGHGRNSKNQLLPQEAINAGRKGNNVENLRRAENRASGANQMSGKTKLLL